MGFEPTRAKPNWPAKVLKMKKDRVTVVVAGRGWRTGLPMYPKKRYIWGPFPTGEYLLVVMDEYSRFPVVEILHSTAARTTIPMLE